MKGSVYMERKNAIVLLHGFDHDHRCWTWVMEELHKLDPTLAVYAVDLPGRGNKKGTTVRTPHEAAAAMMSDIEALGLDRVYLVGHSLAGHTIPLVATLLGEDRTLGQMYIAASVPPQGKSFFSTLFPRFLSLPIELVCKTNIPMKVPAPMQDYLWGGPQMTLKQFRRVHKGAIWERIALFGAPVDREGMLMKNIVWVRTLQDRGATQKNQTKYRENLGVGVECEIPIDAPHDCMISNPKELAELILDEFYKTL